jgi:tetratricopeptide (TPR) repeat protein
MILGPPVLLTFAGVHAATRIYIPVLPFWALLYAAGLEGLGRAAMRRWRLASRRAWIGPVLALATAVAGMGQMKAFLDFNRGMDIRGVMMKIVELTKDTDDFAVIYTTQGDAKLGDMLNWDYYGFCANLEPYFYVLSGNDYPYSMHGTYYIVAENESDVEGALDRTGVDPFMRKTLSRTATIGRLRLYTVGLTPSVEDAYRKAAADARVLPAERAQALTGLGYRLFKDRRYREALAPFLRAESLAPESEKIRSLSGLASLQSFEAVGAEREFGWIVAHDTTNVLAPYYYAEALAAIGRTDEARRWYSWYLSPDLPPGAWYMKDRANAGLAALPPGRRGIPPRPTTADGWEAAAKYFFGSGSLELSAAAMTEAVELEPNDDRWLRLARINGMDHRYAVSIEMLRRILARRGDDTLKLQLALQLMLKGAKSDAYRLLDEISQSSPAAAQARDLRRKFDRM